MTSRTFVFDLDGVVYRGNDPVPGAATTVETLNRLGYQVYFFTNNATQTRTKFVEKLLGMNIITDEAHVMTSSFATACYLKDKGQSSASVYVVGESGLRVELAAIGMKIVDDPIGKKVDYVIAGLDRDFNYDKLNKAQQAILAGATFIATNADPTLPLEAGTVAPGGGSIVGCIKIASGVDPVVIGKPELPAMCKLLEIANAKPEETVVIGDLLNTDILVGNRAGAITVLVLTGVSTREDAENAPIEKKPDFIVDNLTEMLEDERIMGKLTVANA